MTWTLITIVIVVLAVAVPTGSYFLRDFGGSDPVKDGVKDEK